MTTTDHNSQGAHDKTRAQMRPSITPQATRHFVRGILLFVLAYGIWAIGLSVDVVDHQQIVRTHFWSALRNRPIHRFPTNSAALHAAQYFIDALNKTHPHNPCQTGPAFVAIAHLPKNKACIIAIGVRHNRIVIQGYDTQGLRMDSIYEALQPPPRHLD